MEYENEVVNEKVHLDHKLVNTIFQETMKLVNASRIDFSSYSKLHASIFLSGSDSHIGLSFHSSLKNLVVDHGGLNIEIDWVVDTASNHLSPHLNYLSSLQS